VKKPRPPQPELRTSSSRRRPTGIALARAAQLWLDDGRAKGWSPRTVASRRDMLEKLAWCVAQNGDSDVLEDVSPEIIRHLFVYLLEEPEDRRWAPSDRNANARRAAKPSTVDTCYRCLRAFFDFAVREGLLLDSPLANARPPRIPKDQVQPFTDEQVRALIHATKQSDQPLRNSMLLLVLLDTGLRVSELCALRVGDVEPDTKEPRVVGKGGKTRTVYVSGPVRRVLWSYVEKERRLAANDEPLFLGRNGERGSRPPASSSSSTVSGRWRTSAACGAARRGAARRGGASADGIARRPPHARDCFSVRGADGSFG
jgi:site-specific recombinase XerD